VGLSRDGGEADVDITDSWKSLFFYLCTDVIQFAPLKSQGADARARYIQEQTSPDKPPPCSPKETYSLAVAVSPLVRMPCVPHIADMFCIQLNVEPLRRLAMSDVRSKITSANIVNELFSSFTSRCGSSQSNRNSHRGDTNDQKQASRYHENAVGTLERVP
jgi:hypothetical protein